MATLDLTRSLEPFGPSTALGLSKAARGSWESPSGTSSPLGSSSIPRREVELPDGLVEALASDPEARRFLDGLAYTHRKESAARVAAAKRAETRDRRAAQAVEMLREGRTRT